MAAWAGCATAGRQAAVLEGAGCSADLPACVQAVVAAHGGNAALGAHQTLRLRVTDSADGPLLPPGQHPLSNWDTLPLELRADTASGTARWLTEQRGSVVEAAAGSQAAAERARLLARLARLPFALTEPGAKLLSAGPCRFDGRHVVTFEATLADGHAVKVHLDPVTLLMVGVATEENGAPVRVHLAGRTPLGGVFLARQYSVVHVLPGPLPQVPWHTFHVLNATLE